jgi:hypothetical protein
LRKELKALKQTFDELMHLIRGSPWEAWQGSQEAWKSSFLST